MPVIGILGGMGPRATVQFESMLLDRLNGSDQELPTIVTINDGSIPDRNAFLTGTGIDPLPWMQRNLANLENLGAAIICIPCNTACSPELFGRLRPVTSLVIHLPSETVGYMQSTGLRRVLLLATDGTVRSNAYQDLCAEVGIVCLIPQATQQRQVMQIIRAVKRGDMTLARLIGKALAADIAQLDIDGVILGCTELPLVSGLLMPGECIPVDTLAVLADACVGYTKTEQMKGTDYDTRPIYA